MDSKPLTGWFVVKFLCGHVDSMRLSSLCLPGDELICRQCNHSMIVTWIDSEYRIVCLGCPVRQRFGRAKLAAGLAADKHQRKYPTHAIRLMLGRDIVELRSGKRLLQELPFELDDPPPF